MNSQNQQQDISVFSQNLEVPWAIAFLPDKRMLVTERPGRVRIIDTNGNVSSEPAARFNVNRESNGEGGLLGIALHPDFIQNKYVYLYYTYKSNGNNSLNRVVRMKLENDKLTDEEIIVDRIPGAVFHDGGRIKFGPDKFLYITTGDSQNPSLAQDTNSLAGKILRVADDGKPAPGNPLNNQIFSYGHRNSQGIDWDADGQLWATEHGRSIPSGFDEINLIKSGKNYGWPVVQGDESKNGMETPELNSGPTTTWAPSGAVFIGNSLFFAGLKGETLYEAIIRNNKVIELQKHMTNQYGRLREVIKGPDGFLYITTSNRDGRGNPKQNDDVIIKINPKSLS